MSAQGTQQVHPIRLLQCQEEGRGCYRVMGGGEGHDGYQDSHDSDCPRNPLNWVRVLATIHPKEGNDPKGYARFIGSCYYEGCRLPIVAAERKGLVYVLLEDAPENINLFLGHEQEQGHMVTAYPIGTTPYDFMTA